MQSISTKTGDAGVSGLANGKRLPKSDLVFEVLGSLDELNSWLGVIVAELGLPHYAQHAHQRMVLRSVQDTLFYVGAEVAQSPKVAVKKSALTFLEHQATSLQDSLQDGWTTAFLLPGGSVLAAHVDVTRAVCRRVERVLANYATTTLLSPLLLQYLNRLSDYLYIFRCACNAVEGVTEQAFVADTK